MSNTKEMLEMAVELYGLDDIVTKMLCHRRNEELAEVQKLYMRDIKVKERSIEMLFKYLTELKNSLSKDEFRAFMIDVTNDIKANRIAFNKKTSQEEFKNICEMLKGALAR